jgi:hypothetical protein
MKPRTHKGTTGIFNPCVIMSLIIPIMSMGSLRKPMNWVPIPKNTLLLESTGFVIPEPTIKVTWDEEQDEAVVEFDVEYTLSLTNPDWITIDRTTNHWSIFPIPDSNFYMRVGAHYK